MGNPLKKVIKQILHNRCFYKFQEELQFQQDHYLPWIAENEGWKKQKRKEFQKESVSVIPMNAVKPGFSLPQGELLLFAEDVNQMDELAPQAAWDFFSKYPYVEIAYSHEDCVDESGLRHTPWFKPDWSPDTLSSFAYYGSLFVIRRGLFCELLEEVKEGFQEESGEKNLYLMWLFYAKTHQIPANESKKPVGVMDYVLYHRRAPKKQIFADEDSIFSDSLAEEAAKKELTIEELKSKELENGKLYQELTMEEPEPLISVIIPSKDQPEVLETCISSLRKLEKAGQRTEIIVIDNGSMARNRILLTELAGKYQVRYEYQPMEFNFSVMCNRGAALAKGKYLLFLNDDMEAIQPGWLTKMVETAGFSHVGAVGAKLLYPGTDLIQHDGITNLPIGPAHKLLKLPDKNRYYHGQNRHIYDMIGVTAACLMVQKERFLEVGGFPVELAVAYNDVAFCFALFEAGYYNVLRNDVILYHHESLSRGDDLQSAAKKERLLLERDVLYKKYPDLKGRDPFYSHNLAGSKHIYVCNYQFPYEREDCFQNALKWQGEEPVLWENNCLTIEVEIAKLQDRLELSEAPGAYHIEGWSYVLNMDNSHYTRFLMLIGNQGEIYQIPVLNRYRKDVKRILPEQLHVDLAGFVCRIPVNQIKEGTYAIAMLCKDSCSKQQLYKRTSRILTVNGE